MNISKIPANPKPGKFLKVHVCSFYSGLTLCGILMETAQTDLAEANCKRCQAAIRKANRQANHRARRFIWGTATRNGRRVAKNQIALV